ncbi:uncharacterized protein LOC113279363 [Papaver somniferum]|uniref:uncharacterized protein LOC113279363 n=1 Tax=Papaver somniferum TaxID=3469 RepID=UPI000E6FB239|nr:uncharacterized protein LOC113279363 [Papaver somniferum]
MLMKPCWKIQIGEEEWTKLFKGKFQDKKGKWIDYYKKSSIWSGIKWVSAEVAEHTRWLVGDETEISVWDDVWIKEISLKDTFPANNIMVQNQDMKVADLIKDGEWQIPSNFFQFFAAIDLPVIDQKGDRRIWSATSSGNFSVASAYNCIRKKFQPVKWANTVWHKSIHPNVSSNVWKILRGVVPTDETMKKKKFQIASRCPLCNKEEENLEHTLWFCDFSEPTWSCLGGMFQFTNPRSFNDILNFSKHKSPIVKELWRVAALTTLREIVFLRNIIIYENEQPNLKALKQKVMQFTKESEVRMKGSMWNSPYDLQILKAFELKCRNVRGNPWDAGFGFICIQGTVEYIYAMSGGLGLATNFVAEVFAVLCAGEWAISKNFPKVCFQSDSHAAAFQSGEIPWWACTRWNKIKSTLQEWYFTHSYRETNFSADSMANRGAGMAKGEKRSYLSKPDFIETMEIPERPYYKFD